MHRSYLSDHTKSSNASRSQAAGGIPMWLSVLVVGSIGTIYTVIGGIKSVIWADVFQTIIFFIGMITIIIKGSFNQVVCLSLIHINRIFAGPVSLQEYT